MKPECVKMKKKFRVYEKDGAIFRGPDIEHALIVDHVQHGDKWVPYNGNRAAPAMYGDFLGVREYDVPALNSAKSVKTA